MASSTEEVSGTGNDLSTDSKGGQGGGAGGGGGHDTTDTEQKFGMYMREFDFLEYELESLEVKVLLQTRDGSNIRGDYRMGHLFAFIFLYSLRNKSVMIVKLL